MTGRFACLLVSVVLGTATPASAHSDDGVFAGLEAVPGADDLEVALRARLVYADDQDPAPGASVAVDGLGPGGLTAAATPLRDNGDGTYERSLALPAAGAWTLRFTASTPDATAETAYTAPEPTPSTTAVTSAAGGGPRRRADLGDDDDGGGSGPLVAGVVIAVLATGAGVAAFVVLRRRVSA